MSGIWAVARREIVVRSRSKALRISTLIIMIALVAGIVLPSMLAGEPKTYQVAVTGGADVAAAVTRQSTAMDVAVDLHQAADRTQAAAMVDSGAADAAVIDIGEIIWKKGADGTLAPVLQSAVSSVAVSRRAAQAGIDAAQLTALFAPAQTETTSLTPQDSTEDRGPQAAFALIGMILLFIAINVFGGFILSGVVEEKSSRVVEVLLARVTPRQLLAGKVIGIGLLGIGQFVLLGAVALATMSVVQPDAMPTAPFSLIATLVMWFVLGYAFYSVLYGAFGSLASRMEDAQNAIFPLTMLMLVGYLGAILGATAPESWWVTAGSLFPPTAPMMMPMRSALVDVPAWQTLLAVVIMLISVPLVVTAGARLYRGAVLNTGSRLNLRQAWARSR